MIFESEGLPAAYLRGTAMKRRTRSENPSMYPMRRRRPMGVFKSVCILSEIGSVCERGERPGYGNENDEQGQGIPDEHRLEFFGACCFSFCQGRTNGNDDYGKQHEQAVDDSKKKQVEAFFGGAEIVEKVLDDGTLKV